MGSGNEQHQQFYARFNACNDGVSRPNLRHQPGDEGSESSDIAYSSNAASTPAAGSSDPATITAVDTSDEEDMEDIDDVGSVDFGPRDEGEDDQFDIFGFDDPNGVLQSGGGLEIPEHARGMPSNMFDIEEFEQEKYGQRYQRRKKFVRDNTFNSAVVSSFYVSSVINALTIMQADYKPRLGDPDYVFEDGVVSQEEFEDYHKRMEADMKELRNDKYQLIKENMWHKKRYAELVGDVRKRSRRFNPAEVDDRSWGSSSSHRFSDSGPSVCSERSRQRSNVAATAAAAQGREGSDGTERMSSHSSGTDFGMLPEEIRTRNEAEERQRILIEQFVSRLDTKANRETQKLLDRVLTPEYWNSLRTEIQRPFTPEDLRQLDEVFASYLNGDTRLLLTEVPVIMRWVYIFGAGMHKYKGQVDRLRPELARLQAEMGHFTTDGRNSPEDSARKESDANIVLGFEDPDLDARSVLESASMDKELPAKLCQSIRWIMLERKLENKLLRCAAHFEEEDLTSLGWCAQAILKEAETLNPPSSDIVDRANFYLAIGLHGVRHDTAAVEFLMKSKGLQQKKHLPEFTQWKKWLLYYWEFYWPQIEFITDLAKHMAKLLGPPLRPPNRSRTRWDRNPNCGWGPIDPLFLEKYWSRHLLPRGCLPNQKALYRVLVKTDMELPDESNLLSYVRLQNPRLTSDFHPPDAVRSLSGSEGSGTIKLRNLPFPIDGPDSPPPEVIDTLSDEASKRNRSMGSDGACHPPNCGKAAVAG